MKEYMSYELIERIFGKIQPVGESKEDRIRFFNLEEWIQVSNFMLTEIRSIANQHDASEYSVSRAGEKAKRYLEILRDEI